MPDDRNAPSGADGRQGAANSGQPGDAGAAKLDLEAIRGIALEAVNQAITGHVNRLEKRLKDEWLQAASAAGGDSKGKQPEPKPAEQVEALTKRLEAVEKEKEQERAALAAERRDAALRALIERAGAIDSEDVLLVVRPKLSVGEDGAYYAKDSKGALLTAEDFVKQTLQAKPWLRRPSGRSGGGSVGQGTEPVKPQIDRSLPPVERLKLARRLEAEGQL